jgi:hypothetical protein
MAWGLFLCRSCEEDDMSDIILSSLALVLFVATVAYAYACEQL